MIASRNYQFASFFCHEEFRVSSESFDTLDVSDIGVAGWPERTVNPSRTGSTPVTSTVGHTEKAIQI